MCSADAPAAGWTPRHRDNCAYRAEGESTIYEQQPYHGDEKEFSILVHRDTALTVNTGLCRAPGNQSDVRHMLLRVTESVNGQINGYG
jgi:hypothetical protein